VEDFWEFIRKLENQELCKLGDLHYGATMNCTCRVLSAARGPSRQGLLLQGHRLAAGQGLIVMAQLGPTWSGDHQHNPSL
jgi:hypothetical protein